MFYDNSGRAFYDNPGEPHNKNGDNLAQMHDKCQQCALHPSAAYATSLDRQANSRAPPRRHIT